jgi:hypothetical protein
MTIHDRIAEPFYAALGRTLSNWQHVETGLFVIAHCLMETKFDVSSTIFFQIRSAESKLAGVDKLCQRVLSAEDYKRKWIPLFKDTQSYVKYRNGLAHFEISFLTDAGAMTKTAVPVVLTPHHLDTGAIRNGSTRAIDYENLLNAGSEFKNGFRRLIHFGAQNVPQWAQQIALLPPGLRQVIAIVEIEPVKDPPTKPTASVQRRRQRRA